MKNEGLRVTKRNMIMLTHTTIFWFSFILISIGIAVYLAVYFAPFDSFAFAVLPHLYTFGLAFVASVFVALTLDSEQGHNRVKNYRKHLGRIHLLTKHLLPQLRSIFAYSHCSRLKR